MKRDKSPYYESSVNWHIQVVYDQTSDDDAKAWLAPWKGINFDAKYSAI